MQKWFGYTPQNGVPVEIARGCIKFINNNACSFCSIQYDQMSTNSVGGHENAWRVMKAAYDHGYDYLYITADELPLTFPQLLLAMHKNQPSWFTQIPENKRPILAGYARTDGLRKERLLICMRELGFRILMVGLDGGIPISFAALNKPLGIPTIAAGKELFEHNFEALKNAYRYGFKVKAGFVIGHIGMSRSMLEDNVNAMCTLIEQSVSALATVDVEILSPEPGSRDYEYLLNPHLAEITARRLGLKISTLLMGEAISQEISGKDYIDRELAMAKYAAALMPELDMQDLWQTRSRIRNFCGKHNIFVGGNIRMHETAKDSLGKVIVSPITVFGAVVSIGTFVISDWNKSNLNGEDYINSTLISLQPLIISLLLHSLRQLAINITH